MYCQVVKNEIMTKNAVKNENLEVKIWRISQKMTKKKTFENPAPPIRPQKILEASILELEVLTINLVQKSHQTDGYSWRYDQLCEVEKFHQYVKSYLHEFQSVC